MRPFVWTEFHGDDPKLDSELKISSHIFVSPEREELIAPVVSIAMNWELDIIFLSLKSIHTCHAGGAGLRMTRNQLLVILYGVCKENFHSLKSLFCAIAQPPELCVKLYII